MQPYGRDKAREATIISQHATAAEAFAEIDRLAGRFSGWEPPEAEEGVIDNPLSTMPTVAAIH